MLNIEQCIRVHTNNGLIGNSGKEYMKGVALGFDQCTTFTEVWIPK